ncbi:MAG: hypothetical protein ACMXYD_00390 [Candidatus Woesearchaeota archaeon]
MVLNNKTHQLLSILAVLLLAILTLQAISITAHTTTYHIHNPQTTTHGIHNPTLTHELQTTITAPGITEYQRGIHTWN